MVQVRKLTPELEKRAKEEINEDESRLEAGVTLLKEWLKLQPHIKEILDDQWLAAFLRGCKYSLERAQEKLDKFYTARTLIPEFFKNRDPTLSPLRELIRTGCFLPLQNKTDPAGPCLSLIRSTYDPAHFSLNDVFKYSFSLLDLRIYEEDNMIVSGFIDICDMKDLTWQHMFAYTPSIAEKSSKTLAEAYPVRFKGIHFLNTPTGFETVFNLIKLFLPPKLKKRLHIHQNIESLYEYVPKKNLPAEYGGEAGAIEDLKEKWIAKFESRRDFLIETEKYCTDENLRPSKPKDSDSESGVCNVM